MITLNEYTLTVPTLDFFVIQFTELASEQRAVQRSVDAPRSLSSSERCAVIVVGGGSGDLPKKSVGGC